MPALEVMDMLSQAEMLRRVPLFSMFDDDELKVLAAQVDLRAFAARQRIYKMGEPADHAYVLLSGTVRVTTVDEDGQDVVFSEPLPGDVFGFASLLDQTPHRTNAMAVAPSICIEVSREDLASLIEQKPHAGMDMLTTLGRHLHATQELVRGRAARNPNDMIEEDETVGERVADRVAAFGGSWIFIIMFLASLVIYSVTNVYLGTRAWDPYPFILLNLILSMIAAVQAPLIMMSQNRQDKKDRLRGQLDYEVNRRAESEIQGLARKMNLLIDKVGDVEDAIADRARAV